MASTATVAMARSAIHELEHVRDEAEKWFFAHYDELEDPRDQLADWRKDYNSTPKHMLKHQGRYRRAIHAIAVMEDRISRAILGSPER